VTPRRKRARAPSQRSLAPSFVLQCLFFRCRTTGIWNGFLTRGFSGARSAPDYFLGAARRETPPTRPSARAGQLEQHFGWSPGPICHALQATLGVAGEGKIPNFRIPPGCARPPTFRRHLCELKFWRRGDDYALPPLPPLSGCRTLRPFLDMSWPNVLQTRLKIQPEQPRPPAQVDPSILKTPWTDDEDRKIVVAQSKLGNRFAEIAKILDGRWARGIPLWAPRRESPSISRTRMRRPSPLL
jgi:hypothetical protein